MVNPALIDDGSGIGVRHRSRSFSVRRFLVYCCAFSAPWGPVILLPGTEIGSSKLFVGFAFLLIGYWALFVPGKFKFRAFPPAHNWFVALIVLHSLIVYGFLYPEELQFFLNTDAQIDESVMSIERGRGIFVMQFFFYVLFAYAFGATIRSRREMMHVAALLGLGFLSMLFIGSRSAISDSEGLYRQTGGFLNPNDFGAAAMVVVLLSAYVLDTPRKPLLTAGAGLASLFTGLYGVVASGSRSAMGGCAIGLLPMFYYSKSSGKLRYLSMAIILGSAVTLFSTDEVRTTVKGRLNMDAIVETRGSMRIDIYSDYLIQFPRYALQGVGLGRSTEVTKDTYTTHALLIPHNAYIEKVVEFGSLGLLLFVLSLIQFFRILKSPMSNRKEIDRRDVIMLGLFLAWTAVFFIGSGTSRMYWFSWPIIAAYGHLSCGRSMVSCMKHTRAATTKTTRAPRSKGGTLST